MGLEAGPFGAAHGFDSGQGGIGLGQRIQPGHDFFHGGGNIVHIRVIAEQHKVGQPDGLLVGGPLGDGAVPAAVIHRFAVPAELGEILRRDVEKVAAVDRLVEAPVARDAFGVQRRDEKVSPDAAVNGAVSKDVVVDGLASRLGLRGQGSNPLNLSEVFRKPGGVAGPAFGKFG